MCEYTSMFGGKKSENLKIIMAEAALKEQNTAAGTAAKNRMRRVGQGCCIDAVVDRGKRGTQICPRSLLRSREISDGSVSSEADNGGG